ARIVRSYHFENVAYQKDTVSGLWRRVLPKNVGNSAWHGLCYRSSHLANEGDEERRPKMMTREEVLTAGVAGAETEALGAKLEQADETQAPIRIRRADDRGYANHGWLDT